MKCPKCPRPTNRGLLFADGQVIYACTKHAGVIKKGNYIVNSLEDESNPHR
jgi:hypothetical protein